jgi:hypothetical protein
VDKHMFSLPRRARKHSTACTQPSEAHP